MVYIPGEKFTLTEDTAGLLAGTYVSGLGPGWTHVGDATNRDAFEAFGYCCPSLGAHVENCQEIEPPDLTVVFE